MQRLNSTKKFYRKSAQPDKHVATYSDAKGIRFAAKEPGLGWVPLLCASGKASRSLSPPEGGMN